MFASARTHVDNAIGGQHDLRIVFDHHQRVAGVTQPLHHAYHALHIARMQTYRGLIEHEQRVDQRSAQGGGEVDALHFAARQRTRLPVQGQIRQPDLTQIGQACADLTQQQITGLIQGLGQGQRGKEITATVYGQQHQFVDVVRAQTPQQRIGFQACAVTVRAMRVAAIARQEYAHVHLVGLALQIFEVAFDAVPVLACLLAVTLQHPLLLLRVELAPRLIERYAIGSRISQQIVLTFLAAGRLPRLDGALGQRLVAVRDHQAIVDADNPSETLAGVAGTQRRVE